jgi:hypothetical protein
LLLGGVLLAGAAWAQGESGQPLPVQAAAPARSEPADGVPLEAMPAAAASAGAADTPSPSSGAAGPDAAEAAQAPAESADEPANEAAAEPPTAEAVAEVPAPRVPRGVVLPEDVEPQLLALWRPLERPRTPLPVAPLLPPEESPLLPPAPYAAPSVWSTQAYRLLPDKPLAAVRIYAPRPRVPFKEAFADRRDCPLDPFTTLSTDDQLQLLRKDCGRDRLRLGVDGSRVQLAQPQAAALLEQAPASSQAPVKLEVDQLHSQQWSALDTPLTTSVRLGWQGSREGRLGQVQSDQRALVATGGLLRLSPDVALDMSVGRLRSGNLKVGEVRTRTAVTGLWRPLGQHMLYAQWSEETNGTVARELGVRWWLQPGRVSLDLGARRNAEGQPLEPRLALSMSGFLR